MITVILNAYRRPENLKLQVDAIRNQTVEPDDIWLWVNSHEENWDFDFTELDIDRTFYNDYNWKFHGRFAAALLATSEYVALFDDDTIPGSRWFENCLDTMKTHPGILGGAGVILNSDRYEDHERVGWPSCNDEITEVDLVGHAWFLKRDWVQYLWRERHSLDNAEDIQLSYSSQKYGEVNTYCPPHPSDNKELHSSILPWELGLKKAASDNRPAEFYKQRDDAIQNAIANGWKLVRCS
tara:strand:+ start:1387 stop:2103 length:717 start_codon:yes stop_codon:yes gene_type:complete